MTRAVTRMLANTDPALRRAWHPVARSNEVTATPITARLLGDDWVLVRLPDETRAGGETLAVFADRCPHRLAPLSAGTCRRLVPALRLPRLVLRRHRARAGEIPSLGESEHVPPRAVATVPAGIVERHGMVLHRARAAAAPISSTCPRPTIRRSCTARSIRSRPTSAPGS